MSYSGYLIKIGETTIPVGIISAGSYKAVTEKREVGSWLDAEGNWHRDYYQEPKTTIAFTLKARTEAEHLSVSALFTNLHDIEVDYYDTTTGEYKTGTFWQEAPELTLSAQASDAIYFDETNIKLTEY